MVHKHIWRATVGPSTPSSLYDSTVTDSTLVVYTILLAVKWIFEQLLRRRRGHGTSFHAG
jgi:hypothetical protein